MHADRVARIALLHPRPVLAPEHAERGAQVEVVEHEDDVDATAERLEVRLVLRIPRAHVVLGLDPPMRRGDHHVTSDVVLELDGPPHRAPTSSRPRAGGKPSRPRYATAGTSRSIGRPGGEETSAFAM